GQSGEGGGGAGGPVGGGAMAGAFWCSVEDDRQGAPKKVMAEALGEAARLSGGSVEAVWLTDKASDAGIAQLGEWGARKVWLVEDAALAPYRGEVWAPVIAELAGKEAPKAIFVPVTSRQRELLAAVGASRATVEAGWRPHRFKIGQAGRTISPKLYPGCGRSGTLQRLAGMRTAKVSVAVNKDPEAPIFTIADYGIVGDLFEVVPALTEEFKKLLDK